ncbi:MAG: PEP-CTERM sorting domain-containing protein [Sedimentisphaerales bacterium]|nr:PEP-CTERM sorting domain-containing protein [Sedimentisphaerales bacterium]
MRKNIFVGCVCLLFFVSVSFAALVEQVQIIQDIGVTAEYDASAGTTTWSQGASGWMLTDGGKFQSFSDVTVSGTFIGAVDVSSGGLASAVFSSGTWDIVMNGALGMAVHVSGHTVSSYVETETGVDTDHIDGRAVVMVDDYFFDAGWLGDIWGIPDLDLEWEGGLNDLAGLIADITLPNGTGITDYQSDYTSTNTTITLWADESVVPEPMTVILLGLGALSLRKRR